MIRIGYSVLFIKGVATGDTMRLHWGTLVAAWVNGLRWATWLAAVTTARRCLLISFILSPIMAQESAIKSGPIRRAGVNPDGVKISAVSAGAGSFNPARSEKVSLSYVLSRDAKVTIRVLSPDRQEVSVAVSTRIQKSGKATHTWNGKDSAGRVVPNEAYTFIIEATDNTGAKAVYEPATTTGGEFGDIRRGNISRESGTIAYDLSQPSRVLLRAGIPGSALLKTVVDWEPRPSGSQTEYWNGRDEDNLVDVLGIKERSIIISYMTLPENSVITYGNAAYTYREYAERYAKNRPKLSMPAFANNRKVSPHFLKDRTIDRSFRLRITFPELDKSGAASIPVVRDKLLVSVEVDPKNRDVVSNQQLEVILFTDLQFHSEEERGYLPFRYPLDVASLPAGEHVLTVNVVTFGDQVGIGSRKFKVVK